MNKETIQARIQKLEQERDQVKASLIMYEGALADCKHWLDELNKETNE